MLQQLGLNSHRIKTKIMRINQTNDNLITFGETSLQKVESWTHLSRNADKDGRACGHENMNTKGKGNFHNTRKSSEVKGN